MKNLPRITKILKIEPFKILTLWNNSEVRLIDFEPFFVQWKAENQVNLLQLTDFEAFKGVLVSDTHTLFWENILITVSLKNRKITASLDLDPDVLFEKSTLVKKIEKLPIGNILRNAREIAGLSQLQVAMNSGTSRNYISRIENGKSDIQLETLHKIVKLGIGKEMLVEIR